MVDVQIAPLTAEDYRALPEGSPRCQLIEGDLAMAPAPSRYHQDISGNLFFLIQSYLEEHPVGKLYAAPFDVYLDETNVFQPDLVFVEAGRLSILNDAGAAGPPDLVVEVLSPRTARLDESVKRHVYSRKGVKELWLVDPDRRLVKRYRFDEDAEHPVATFSEQDTFTCPFFPGLEFKGRRVFRQ